MKENIKVEVALEIISMCTAIAKQDDDLDKMKTLNYEREEIYRKNKDIIEKVISEYGKIVKKKLED